MIAPRDFTLPFVKKVQLTDDVYSFYFSTKDGPASGWDFLPGQYIKMFLDIANPDDRGNSRSFSIASSPLEKEYLMITTHIIQSAFKKTLVSLTPGTEVKFFGPIGRFIFDEKETQQHIFLAGGIGITPFHSMLLYASEKNVQTPITLFVSFSRVEEIIFYDELIKISTNHPNIKVIYTVTHPSSFWQVEQSETRPESVDPGVISFPRMTGKWVGETGRISEELIKKYCPNFSTSLFYISGPPVMVDGMIEIVKNLNVPDEQARKEKFIGY